MLSTARSTCSWRRPLSRLVDRPDRGERLCQAPHRELLTAEYRILIARLQSPAHLAHQLTQRAAVSLPRLPMIEAARTVTDAAARKGAIGTRAHRGLQSILIFECLDHQEMVQAPHGHPQPHG